MIHEKAHVDINTVTVGKSTNVWQFASLIRGAIVGEDCTVGSCAIIDGAVVGDRCLIGHGASINPGVLIGDDVFIGPNSTICNDMWPEASKEGWNLDRVMSYGQAVIIHSGASICANATVLPGVVIGECSLVSAGAVIDRNLPAGMVWRRNGYVSQMPKDRRERRMRVAK